MPALITTAKGGPHQVHPLHDGDIIGFGEGCQISLAPAERPLYLARFRQDATDAWLETLVPGVAGPDVPAGTLVDLSDRMEILVPRGIRLRYVLEAPAVGTSSQGESAEGLHRDGGVPRDQRTLFRCGSTHIDPSQSLDSEEGDPTVQSASRAQASASLPSGKALGAWMTGQIDPGPLCETLPQLPKYPGMAANYGHGRTPVEEEVLTATLLMCPRERRRQLVLARERSQGAGHPGQHEPRGAVTSGPADLPSAESVSPNSMGSIPDTLEVRKCTKEAAPFSPGSASVRVEPKQVVSAVAPGGTPQDSAPKPTPRPPIEVVDEPRRAVSGPSSVALSSSRARSVAGMGAAERAQVQAQHHAQEGVGGSPLSHTSSGGSGGSAGRHRVQATTFPERSLGLPARVSTEPPSADTPDPDQDGMEVSRRLEEVKPMRAGASFFKRLTTLLRPGLERSTLYWVLVGLGAGTVLTGVRVLLGI